MEAKGLPIDFRHLETFCRVAIFKSFSKAAEGLFLTQSTVSGHILALEKALARVPIEGIDTILRPIYIVTHKGRTRSPIGMAFLRFLKTRKKK